MTTNTRQQNLQPVLDKMTPEHKDATLTLLNDTVFDLSTILQTMSVMAEAIDFALENMGDIERAYESLASLIRRATTGTADGGVLDGATEMAVLSPQVVKAVERSVQQALKVHDELETLLGSDEDLEDALVKALADAGYTADQINDLLGL